MIVVKVELWSAITHQKTELARMAIANIWVNDTGSRGDYDAWTYKGRSKTQLDEAMSMPKIITRQGQVKNHARLQEHVWNLVAKALKAMEYGNG